MSKIENTPFFQTNRGQLYHADCFNFLKDMPKNSVDMVLTDPPYSENTQKNARTNKGKGHGNRYINFTCLSKNQFISLCELCLRVSKGWVVMTCDHKHAALMFNHKAFVRIGAWVKTNPMPQLSADRPCQGHEAVLILHSGATRKRWNRGGGSAIWRHNVCDRAIVPTQKPIKLIVSLLSDFAQEGDTIFDPFFGSGTTGVACESLNLEWIGVEKDKSHCKIAAQRLLESIPLNLMAM